MISRFRSTLRRGATIGAVAGLVAAAAVAGTTAAQAATQSANHSATATAVVVPLSDLADCPAQDLCWWVDAYQVGKMHPVRDAISDWTTQKEATCPSGTWNDCASTLYNNSDNGAVVFDTIGHKGRSLCVPPGDYLPNLDNYRYYQDIETLNDTISSNAWVAGGC
jgi:hypothetical protein